MASVSKRVRAGKVSFLVRWRDEERRECKRSFPRKTDADKFRAAIEHQLNSGTYVDPKAGKITFREYGEAWRALMHTPDGASDGRQPHRTNTARRVESNLRVHVYPAIGDRPLSAIRHSEIQALVGRMAATLKPSSVRPVVRTLSSVFNAAVRDRLIPFDPSDDVGLPELDEVEVRFPTVEELDRMVDELPRRFQAIALVAALAGLRPAEVYGLKVSDVNFFRKEIRVRQQSQPHGIGPLKNRSAYRTVPIGDELKAVLAEHLAEYPAKGDEFIFRAANGRVMSDALLKQAWMHARNRAAVAGLTMHHLRHFYASVLIRAGLSVKEVSKRLGHKNAAMTLNVYTGLWPEDDDRTREAIDQLRRDQRRGA